MHPRAVSLAKNEVLECRFIKHRLVKISSSAGPYSTAEAAAIEMTLKKRPRSEPSKNLFSSREIIGVTAGIKNVKPFT